MEIQERKEEKPTFKQMATAFVPTATAATIGVEFVMHAPPPIEIAALLAAGALAYNSPKIYAKLREQVPSLPAWEPKPRKPGEYTVTDRLLGRHSRDRAALKEEQWQNEDAQTLAATIDVTPNATVYYAPDDEETLSLPINTAAASGSLFRFSELLDAGFVPTINKIFVGRTMDGKDIFVTAKDLCHVALAGKTGGGKGSLMRLLMVQLCYIGAKVLLLNSHYMRWVCADAGPEFDEDWTPFEGINKRTGKPYLEAPPSDSAEVKAIERCLIWAVETLLEKRKVEGREGGKRFSPYFIVIDEWPAVAKKIKDGPDRLAELLREGRKFGVFVIVASQDFQVKTIGMDGGSVRKCLLTCFYTGGDTTTARELLYEKGQDIPENKVGKGVVMLRCVGTKNEATLAKVPFVDNDAVYRLLGPSTFQVAKQAVVVEEPEAPLPQATVPVIPALTPVAQQAPAQQSGGLTIDQILAIINTGKLSEDALLKLIDKLPVVQDAADEQGNEDEVDDPRAHLRLVSSEAVEGDFYAQETERLPETHTPSGNTGRFTKALSPELQKAYEAYQQGYTTSRTLAPMMAIGKTKAAELLQELKRRKLVS